MAYARFTHASFDARRPLAFGCCDRCGFVYPHHTLQWQWDWRGFKLQNLRILVCQSCRDIPQEQLRQIVLPVDPVPIANPRPGEFGAMVISSNPDPTSTIVPNALCVESSIALLPTNNIYPNLSPLVTEGSSQILMPEWQDTPIPQDPGATYFSTSVAPSSI